MTAKPILGFCKSCGKLKKIINKKRFLCEACRFKRNHVFISIFGSHKPGKKYERFVHVPEEYRDELQKQVFAIRQKVLEDAVKNIRKYLE